MSWAMTAGTVKRNTMGSIFPVPSSSVISLCLISLWGIFSITFCPVADNSKVKHFLRMLDLIFYYMAAAAFRLTLYIISSARAKASVKLSFGSYSV